MLQTYHAPLVMAQDADPRLSNLNGAIGELLKKLQDKDLISDARRRLEKDLLALVDRRIEIEEKAKISLRGESSK
jgi:hypothetical protein